MLLQLILNKSHGQPGRIYRHIDILKHIGQRPDMILVPVSDHKALHLAYIILQIGDIRNDQVNPQHIVLRK